MCKVTVIMPLYNAEKYVFKAVNSIINQTYKDFELIIINDGSVDTSLEIVSKINDRRIKVFNNDTNRGIAYTRNRGIDLAKGEYIAIMDDDDIASQKRLQMEVDYLDNNPNIVAVVGNACRIDGNDNDLNEMWRVCKSPRRLTATFLFGNPVPNSSAMVRKKVLIENGIYFRDKQYGIEDYRFWSEVSLVGLIGSIDKVMLYNRLGHGSESAVQNTCEAREKRKVEYNKIKDILFEGYGVSFSDREKHFFYEMFAEGKTTATFFELKESVRYFWKIVRTTRYTSISGAIIQVCCATYIRMLIKTIIFKFSGKNKMWWDFENRQNKPPKELQ